jgi:undecaprenyl pyrophosphate phosphatase UppP
LIPFLLFSQLEKFSYFSQVWGTSTSGAEVPVAWVSGISQSSTDVSFELDVAWVAKASAVAPFNLKNVRVQDANIQTVLSTAAELPVTVVGSFPSGLYNKQITEITDQMMNGRRPANLSSCKFST